jgi:hypothetical protein
MTLIGLIVTGDEALADFRIFCRTLEVWHPDAHLYVFTDSDTPVSTSSFKGTIHVRVAMNAYKGLTRSDMEKRKGILYDTLFKDYTYEKANVLDWMWEVDPLVKERGGWFLDADLAHLAPLPVVPEGTTLALSPHGIRTSDERLYGKYNAGFMWFKDRSLLSAWRAFGFTSRFFEQAALEELTTLPTVKLYEFGPQVNFGWWRMYQNALPPADIQGRFSLHRADTSIGIRYLGAPLQSIHTHWGQSASVTGAFNAWIRAYFRRFASHAPIAQFLRVIGG